MVANLSEAACEAVGANGVLARVGAYYHDVGKQYNHNSLLKTRWELKIRMIN